MARSAFLGEFEQITLLAVARLGEDAYGVAIRQEIEERSGRPVAIGSVYAALDRMERKGLIRSAVGEPTPERGGRAKRFYELSPVGMKALADARKTLDRFWEDLELVSALDPEVPA
jgi:DNA-binding PadR family transcriptional regulator